jgi:glycosyltransferase involved in cell wall biosynthesis
MPSRQENFGMSAFEALAHGVPVLLSDRIDWAESIRAAGAGWTTELDPARLRESLSAALADPAGRTERGRTGRALVRDDYSWSAVAARLTETYSRILTPSRPPLATTRPNAAP